MPRFAPKLNFIAAVVSGAALIGGLSACHRAESTAKLMADAKAYQQKGDNKSALIQLKNAVEKSPEDGEARAQLGTLEWQMGDAASAEKELRKARSLGIANDRVLPMLGQAMLQQGHAKEMLEDITAERAANSAPLLVLRGDALLTVNSPADAKAAYDKALSLDPNNGNALLGLMRYAGTQNDREGAERYLADALAKDPKNPEVWMANGAILRFQNKPAEALAAYDQVLKLKPDHRNAHIEKATVDISLNKFPEAKAEIDAADKASPNNLLVLYTRALYEFSQGKYSEAHDDLLKVLKVAPEHGPSILMAGATELNLGSTAQAEQHLRSYLTTNPGNVYARKLLAQTLLKTSRPAEAATTLAPVLNDSTQDAQLLALAGQAYMQTRDFNKANAYLEKAAQLAPQAAGVRTSLGLSKMAKGDQAGGITELEKATALDPKSTQATMALVQTEMGLRHYDKALDAVNSLEKQQPNDPQVQNSKGAVYMVMGDKANARAAFDKAVALQPTYLVAVANLARLDMMDNNPAAAKQRFEKVLQTDKSNVGAMEALGDLSIAQKKPDEATGWYEKASAVDPNAVAPALKLGAHYLRTNQPQKTLTLARKLQTANPTNPELLDMMGQAQVATKDVTGALDTYSKLVNVAPKSPQAQLRLAGVHMLTKNEAAAAEDIKRAIGIAPDFMPARIAQIELAMRAGHADEALEVARDVQKQNPKSPAGFAIEGDLLMNQKKPAPAAAAYDKAFALNKSSELLLKSLVATNAAGKGKEAQARAEQWLKDHPSDPGVNLYVAEANLANKDFKSAIALLQNAQKTSPNDPVILNNLAWAYQQDKDPRALATAEQAVRVAGDNPGVLDTLGWLLVEQGNLARGVPLLQKAGNAAPNAPDIQYHLAVALNKSGDKQGARKALDKSLAQNQPFSNVAEARALLKSL